MNSSSFERTAGAFQHAHKFRLQTMRLDRFPLVDDLISETRKWFSALHDEESQDANEMRVEVWRLRTSVLYSLVKFDDPALDIREIGQAIVTRGVRFPALRARCNKLAALVQALEGHALNPKRDKVRAELQRHAGDGRKIALVVALARNHLPAFSDNLIRDFQSLGQGIQFVTSRRQLLSSIFDHIVVPFGTSQCALANEVLCGYRAPAATVIAYRSEKMTPGRRVRLPCAISERDRSEEFVEDSDYQPNDEALSDNDDFWSAIKQREVAATVDGTTDTAYFLPARGVLLTNGAHVFLRDDSKVIEISDWVEGRRSMDNIEKRFPRTPVRKLQTGDLIVLRVQGSGDYLTEVADKLMRRDGKRGLRDSAVNWKHPLKEVLTKYGSRWFLQQLQKRGFSVANHTYIWKWTSDEVISPQKESLFFEIIAILDDCGATRGEHDTLEAAKEQWQEIKELKKYQMKAGQKIRRNLLRRLRTLVGESPEIGSEYELQIPGVSAGTLAIVRIASVDTKVVSLPYHRTGIVSMTETGGSA